MLHLAIQDRGTKNNITNRNALQNDGLVETNE